MSKYRFHCLSALLLSFGFWLAGGDSNAAEPAVGGSYEAWQQHREAVSGDPSVVRYYPFEEARDAATPIPSVAGEEGALSFIGAPAEEFQVVEGRWPGKKAVRLDRGSLAAEPFAVDNQSFTVAAWLRTNGLGVHRGDAVPAGATLLSVGIGYWDGWRVTLLYPDQTVGFEIGRPQPVNAVGVRTTEPAPDGVWHHLAATWDGQRMRIFVDGLPAAVGEYAGEYTPPQPGAQFRVGFADAGWGGAVLDVDEVVVYKRALTEEEVLRAAYFYAPLPAPAVAQFLAAARAFEQRDYATAAAEYAALAALRDLHPHLLSLARLRLGQCLREQKKLSEATPEFVKVLNGAQAPENHRRTALAHLLQLLQQGASDLAPPNFYERILTMPEVSSEVRLSARFNLARGYRQEGNFDAAREQYARLLELAEVPARERLNARLELGHTCLEAKDYPAARAEYAKILAQDDAPVHFKSYAHLLIAQSYVREGNYAAAKEEYAKLRDRPDAPPHLRWEAEERQREVERLPAGLPARDPAWSRVQLPPLPAPALTLYVAPNGSDFNPGTADRPLATLEGARAVVRSLKAQGELPPGGVAVILRGGEYRCTASFTLTAEDSGTAAAPIVYRAAEGETVRLTGGIRLTGFQPVEDPALLERLPEEARGRVWQLDLRAQGITDFGELVPRGFGGRQEPVLELFCDGQPMPLARWPNEGFVRTGNVIQPGSGEQGVLFEYEGDRPARWLQAREAWLFGYWYWLWADGTMAVESIDPATRRIKTKNSTAYGTRSGQPYYAFNLLEEIDQPGEWYLDRENGVLYFYPPADPAQATVELSMLNGPLVQMDQVSHVTFRGLTFELGRSTGVVVNGGEHCLLDGCTLRNLGGDGVILNGGTNHGVLGCDIYHLGRGGVRVAGGDRRTLTPGGHFVENCHIFHFSRIDRTYTPAVWLDGVGHRIAHNLFHDSPGHAMRLEGNDHVVEFNEIHSVVYETDDQGGLDMFFNPSYRGNVLRYNFWHHLGDGQDRLSRAGIRLDDAICGTLVYGNVFYRCSEGYFGGVQIHGGKENILDNNLFVECKYGVSFSGWGEQRWKEVIASENVVKMLTETVDIRKPPYRTRYPALAHLAENPDVNSLWRNVVVHCGAFLTRDRGIQDLMDNYVTSQDPGFVDPDHWNFQLKPDSPVYDRIGFRPIPFEEIGLYQDEHRASWPVRHGITEHYQLSERGG